MEALIRLINSKERSEISNGGNTSNKRPYFQLPNRSNRFYTIHEKYGLNVEQYTSNNCLVLIDPQMCPNEMFDQREAYWPCNSWFNTRYPPHFDPLEQHETLFVKYMIDMLPERFHTYLQERFTFDWIVRLGQKRNTITHLELFLTDLNQSLESINILLSVLEKNMKSIKLCGYRYNACIEGSYYWQPMQAQTRMVPAPIKKLATKLVSFSSTLQTLVIIDQHTESPCSFITMLLKEFEMKNIVFGQVVELALTDFYRGQSFVEMINRIARTFPNTKNLTLIHNDTANEYFKFERDRIPLKNSKRANEFLKGLHALTLGGSRDMCKTFLNRLEDLVPSIDYSSEGSSSGNQNLNANNIFPHLHRLTIHPTFITGTFYSKLLNFQSLHEVHLSYNSCRIEFHSNLKLPTVMRLRLYGSLPGEELNELTSYFPNLVELFIVIRESYCCGRHPVANIRSDLFTTQQWLPDTVSISPQHTYLQQFIPSHPICEWKSFKFIRGFKWLSFVEIRRYDGVIRRYCRNVTSPYYIKVPNEVKMYQNSQQRETVFDPPTDPDVDDYSLHGWTLIYSNKDSAYHRCDCIYHPKSL